MWLEGHKTARLEAFKTRNFYGVLTIFEDAKDNPERHNRALLHGHALRRAKTRHVLRLQCHARVAQQQRFVAQQEVPVQRRERAGPVADA